MRALLSTLALLLAALAAAEELVIDFRDAPTKPVVPITAPDGEPIFLRELYSLTRREDMAVATDLGFNAAIRDGLPAYEHAAAAGFWVTESNWFQGPFDAAQAVAVGEEFRGLPRLVSYNLNDEPDLRINIADPENLQRAATAIRQADQQARFSATLAGWGRARGYWPDYAQVLDILRVDPYPLISRQPLHHVLELVQAGQAAAPGKPVHCVLQAWSWPGGPFPNAAQARVMAWQALIAGAAGISYFDWNDAEWVRHPSFWREVPAINRDIALLEPLLARGQRTQVVGVGGVVAALWRGDDGAWAVLVAPLDALEEPVTVTLKLPGDLGSDAWLHHHPGDQAPRRLPADHGLTVTLSSLQAATILPAPMPAQPTAGTPWLVDWAGRPIRMAAGEAPAHYQRPLPQTAFSGGAEIEFFIEGGLPIEDPLSRAGLVYRAAPGTDIPMTLLMEADPAAHLDLHAISWHDTQELLTGQALAPLISLQPRPLDSHGTRLPRRRAYELRVHLPTDRSWHMQRDHLLRLRLRYQWYGATGERDYVLRFRLTPPVSLNWHWDGRTSGHLRAVPTLPAALYAVSPDAWQASLSAPPLTVEPIPADDGFGFRLTAPRGASEPTPLSLQATLRAGTSTLATAGVAQVVLREGKLLRPDDPRQAAAAWLAPQPAEATFEELWPLRNNLPRLEHFLVRGSHSYASPPSAAWFAWNDEHLLCFMETELAADQYRAETTQPDSPFLGDSLMALLLAGGDERLYVLQLNPGGIGSHVAIGERFDPSWNPRLTWRGRYDDGTWQLIVRLPWRELGWAEAPTAGELLRVNVGNGRSIAPRIWQSWHFWGAPFDPDASLADLTLQPPPE